MADKCEDEVCKGTVGPDYPTLPSNPSNPCNTVIPGIACDFKPREDCGGFSLADESFCYAYDLVDEALNIGGAPANVFKLLGVKEQGKLVDCTGFGQAISGGERPGYPASNAYDAYVTEWRSYQAGPAVNTSSYIGYDFGEIKIADESRRMYGTDTSIYKHITAVNIKQSSDPAQRVTQARIERSDDGQKWLGVAVVRIPDDDCLNLLLFKDSVPSRYWRIRPIGFEGPSYWSVQAIEMFHNYSATDIDNVQDKVLLENRDRDYDKESVAFKVYYDLIDVTTELTRFGIELPTQSFYLQVGFVSCVQKLGRPMVIGDIIELPPEAEYSGEMRRILKYLEVVDVGWSAESYTPGWHTTMLRVIAQPAYHSQETQDIFGDLDRKKVDDTGLYEGEDGNSDIFQDYFAVSQTTQAEAHDNTPQRGAEGSSHIREFTAEELATAEQNGVPHLNRLGLNPTGTYVEDAMPPNNEPFTEGDELPAAPNEHGAYHRLTYVGLADDIPARLYRYSESKGWIFLEKDRRAEYDHTLPVLQEFLTSENRVPTDAVTQQDRDRIEKDCE